MSLTKEAIQHLQNTGTPYREVLTTNVPVLAMPDSIGIHSLEKYQQNRSSFRGFFITSMIRQFSDYFEQTDQLDASVFVDSAKMQAKTIFDLGSKDNPGHGHHFAVLELSPTAPYKEVISKEQMKLDQREMAELLEDWRDLITPLDAAGEPIKIQSAIAAIRNVTIECKSALGSEQEAHRSSRTALETIEAKSKDVLPVMINFTCNPYPELTTREFYIRVNILTGGREPIFSLRVTMMEDHRDQMAQEFSDLIKHSLPESTTVLIGDFKLGN